jgi:prepilin-type N-terminal cleavage/methylation domain-containing protein
VRREGHCPKRLADQAHPVPAMERNEYMMKNGARGFTMIELLVVIAVISLLAAILLPALKGARDTAKRTAAITQMNYLGSALTEYTLDFGVPPPSSIVTSTWTNTGDLEGLGRVFSDINVNAAESGADADEVLPYFLGTAFQKSWAAAVAAANIKTNGYMEFTSDVLDRDVDADGFYELLDPWGHPYAYVPFYEYRTSGGAYQRGSTVAGGQDISRGFYNKQTWQIMCRGADGVWDIEFTGASAPYVTTGQLGKPLKGVGADVASGGDDFGNW